MGHVAVHECHLPGLSFPSFANCFRSLEGSGGGSHPGGLLKHDPVGTQPRLTNFPKHKRRENRLPNCEQRWPVPCVGHLGGSPGMSRAPYLPSGPHSQGHRNRADQVFSTSGCQFLQTPLKKNMQTYLSKRGNMREGHKGCASAPWGVFRGP